jgi:hypothetical protein
MICNNSYFFPFFFGVKIGMLSELNLHIFCNGINSLFRLVVMVLAAKLYQTTTPASRTWEKAQRS